MAILGESVELASQLLEQGKLVAIPTETVYGLAANALDSAAVARIFEAKNRPFFDPLIVHVGNVNDVAKYCINLPSNWHELLNCFWPGPLTFLFERNKEIIPDLVVNGSDWVAMRMPNHTLCLKLLQLLPFPLAAPSANPFGYISPTTAEHVLLNLGNKIDYILDGGACQVGIESTIIKVHGKTCEVLRLGGLDISELDPFFETIKLQIANNSNPSAPGQLDKHYSPTKPIAIVELDSAITAQANVAYIRWKQALSGVPIQNQRILSPTGDLNQAAANLFTYLRQCDSMTDMEAIIAEKVPNVGLGLAINDRLQRAAAK